MEAETSQKQRRAQSIASTAQWLERLVIGQSASAAHFSRIPELVDHLFGCIVDGPDEGRAETLLTCALAGRDWRDRALTRLYERVVIYTLDEANSFKAAITRRRDRQESLDQTRSLVIRAADEQSRLLCFRVMKLLPRVATLSFKGVEWPCGELPSSITALSITDPRGYDLFLLEGQQALRHLRIRLSGKHARHYAIPPAVSYLASLEVRTDRPARDGEGFHAYIEPFSIVQLARNSRTTLRHLSIHNFSVHRVLGILRELPHLEELDYGEYIPHVVDDHWGQYGDGPSRITLYSMADDLFRYLAESDTALRRFIYRPSIDQALPNRLKALTRHLGPLGQRGLRQLELRHRHPAKLPSSYYVPKPQRDWEAVVGQYEMVGLDWRVGIAVTLLKGAGEVVDVEIASHLVDDPQHWRTIIGNTVY